MFDIRELVGNSLPIIREIPSEYTVECPCCSGKLKISKRKGAYMCVTECCFSSDIRQALGYQPASPKSHLVNPYDMYQPSDIKLTTNDLQKLTKPLNYKFQSQQRYHEKYQEPVIESYYYHSENHRAYRLDLLISKEKCMFPNSRIDRNHRWRIGANDTFPWYNSELLAKSSDKFILVVEGEKTAHEVSNQGYLAITPPMGFGWNEMYIFKEMSKYLGVAGYVLVPDNDKVGLKKMQLFGKVAKTLNIPSKLINPTEYQHPGDDLYDLIQSGHDLTTLLTKYL